MYKLSIGILYEKNKAVYTFKTAPLSYFFEDMVCQATPPEKSSDYANVLNEQFLT